MKTRMTVVTVLALAVAGAGAGCKKKNDKANEGGGAMKPAEGSAMKPAEGSAVAPPTDKPAPKTGKELAAHYLDCGNQMAAGKWEEFTKHCTADGFVSHMAGSSDQTAAQSLESM
jgi:hypothetical protein